MLHRARVAGGETILVTGPSGGVGSALVQLSRIRGARVIGIVCEGKEEKLRELGAETTITRQTEDLYQVLVTGVGEKAIDVVADVVGGIGFHTLLRMLKRQGH